jgi:Flp pilus assembly protein TadG
MKFLHKSRHLLGRFKQEHQGTAAVEFALIFPVLLIVYFGLIEISNSLEAKRKVENAANLTGMLVAQATTVNDAYFVNVFKATEMVFEPFDITPMKVVVSSVVRVFENNAWVNKVDWSESYGTGATPRTVDSVLNPPGNILGDNRGVIYTEVEYTYSRILSSTTFNNYFPNTMTFKKEYWAHPRYVVSIPFE